MALSYRNYLDSYHAEKERISQYKKVLEEADMYAESERIDVSHFVLDLHFSKMEITPHFIVDDLKMNTEEETSFLEELKSYIRYQKIYPIFNQNLYNASLISSINRFLYNNKNENGLESIKVNIHIIIEDLSEYKEYYENHAIVYQPEAYRHKLIMMSIGILDTLEMMMNSYLQHYLNVIVSDAKENKTIPTERSYIKELYEMYKPENSESENEE